jgi:hypothetical protein
MDWEKLFLEAWRAALIKDADTGITAGMEAFYTALEGMAKLGAGGEVEKGVGLLYDFIRSHARVPAPYPKEDDYMLTTVGCGAAVVVWRDYIGRGPNSPVTESEAAALGGFLGAVCRMGYQIGFYAASDR